MIHSRATLVRSEPLRFVCSIDPIGLFSLFGGSKPDSPTAPTAPAPASQAAAPASAPAQPKPSGATNQPSFLGAAAIPSVAQSGSKTLLGQ